MKSSALLTNNYTLDMAMQCNKMNNENLLYLVLTHRLTSSIISHYLDSRISVKFKISSLWVLLNLHDCTVRLESDLAGNLVDRFSRNEAQTGVIKNTKNLM